EQLFLRCVFVNKNDVGLQVQFLDQPQEKQPVLLAGMLDDIRVCFAKDQVYHIRIMLNNLRQCVQHGFYALVPTDKPEGKHQLFVCEAKLLAYRIRSEEHTSELQSRENLVCRLLLEKKNR